MAEAFIRLISQRLRIVLFTAVVSAATVIACKTIVNTPAPTTAEVKDTQPNPSPRFLPLNLEAGTKVLYEIQFRSANACNPSIGAPWQRAACTSKPSPKVTYRARGMSCPIINDLLKVKLGTIEDTLAETSDHHAGITLRYVKDRVGANVVWVMPPFPNNDMESIPDSCDNLGSPYAVRDYMHISGSLAQGCISTGRDEYSDNPCWGNGSFERFIQKAHSLGLKVMLDVAFNHFGHNYSMYDYSEYLPTPQLLEKNSDLNQLWDFGKTFEQNLVTPAILDSPAHLNSLASREPTHRAELAKLKSKCPSLSGQKLVVAYNTWRNSFDWERNSFSCAQDSLEDRAPGFYLGSNKLDPARSRGDISQNGQWRDVKFLFHRTANSGKQFELARNREYLFRVMNYWTSRGVDGFRLDHATEGESGLSPDFWNYVISKNNYYANRRGQSRPLYMAEEFFDKWGMDRAADIMTEGYLFSMNERKGGTKNTAHVEGRISDIFKPNYLPNFSYVLTTLETHDEPRLVQGTGFSQWTGAGFWGIGATIRSTPMILMGQEFGEPWGLSFKRSDFLRSRFIGSPNYFAKGVELRDYYRSMITGRLNPINRALYSQNYAFLRSNVTNAPDDRIFAQMKWSEDLNVVFTFHNLWETDVEQTFFIDPNDTRAIGLKETQNYKLIDVFSNIQMGPCHLGKELAFAFYIKMSAATRAQWLRLEQC